MNLMSSEVYERIHGKQRSSAVAEFYSMITSNRLEDYERLYETPSFLELYLSPDRMKFYSELAKIAISYSPRNLIDVGCGAGQFLSEVSKSYSCKVYGAEATRSGTIYARRLVPQARIEQCSVYNIEETFPGTHFDLICCFQVLEHLEDPEGALRKMMLLKSNGGKLLLSVPDGRKDTWEGHINFWSKQSLGFFVGKFGKFSVDVCGENLIAREV
jgi:2-polyprenyl-3-methyl-5-hydroxy-6-metoxy-1,4-benzoquinol methylase